MRRSIQRFIRSEGGAIAPTVALALFGLIAVGGVAFDYARLAGMDTELQQAADQAALAAATQLDRADGAQARATAAIQNSGTNRLAKNLTRFAQQDATSGMTVEITSITFCKAFDDSVASTASACTAATGDSDSAFVVVTTQARTARYAFTPIVGLFSGTVSASAVAGVQSSICSIAPLFVCTDDANFPSADDVGDGLLMKTGAQNSWFPGNYGFLNFGQGNQGIIDALLGHGLNGCQPIDESNTAPGNKNATDAINTRFDIYDGTGATKDSTICNLATGDGCPAADTGKDEVLQMTNTKSTGKDDPQPNDDLSCGATGGTVTYAADFAQTPTAKGFDRDDCHYAGNCTNGNFGNGVWDFAGYMAANHPGVDTATIPKAGDTPTRYEVYTWELAHVGSGALAPRQIGATVVTSSNGPQNTKVWTYTRQCAFFQPKLASAAYPAEKDRRILPVVAAQCDGLNGASNLDAFKALRVFDVFLTEPSLNRTTAAGWRGATDEKEIYGEVLGPAETFGGSGGFQYYSRNKPYLVR